MDCKVIVNMAVSKFEKVISLLDRTQTGHAKFKRAPIPNQTAPQMQPTKKPTVFHATLLQQIPTPLPFPKSPKMESLTPLSLSTEDEDVEVNITGCTNSIRASVVGDFCDDAVGKCSSSFIDTGSGTESASFFSDTKVESRMYFGDPSLPMCDEWCDLCWGRKKRRTKSATIHWRRFICPLMWRCKWIELQLKQLQSQAHKNEKELTAYNHTKHLDFAHLTLDGSDVKSAPVSGRMHRNKVMKRNKRKRFEEECDLAS